MVVWWTDELWAVLSYQDQTEDALLGYNVMSRMLKDYYFISPLSVDMETTKTLEISGTPILENDAGVKSIPIKVHPSLKAAMPNLMAFPKKSPDGKDIITPDTKSIKVTLRFRDAAADSSYTWNIPIKYPAIAQEAEDFLHKPQDKKIEDMSENELLSAYLPSTMLSDIGSGYLVALLPPEMFAVMLKKAPELTKDRIAKEVSQELINGHTFFAITSFDQDPKRISATAKTAKAIDTSGKTLTLDVDTYNSFLEGRSNKQEAFEILVFPQLGKQGDIKLILTDPDTGEESTFNWSQK